MMTASSCNFANDGATKITDDEQRSPIQTTAGKFTMTVLKVEP
jgi:hypothetical protein